MSKKKKIIIISAIVLALLFLFVVFLVGVILLIKFLPSIINPTKPTPIQTPVVEKITISFDADGGSSVENIVFEKGKKIDLPVTSKDGYTFVGWFDGEEEITSETTEKIEKDITLKAKWEEIKADDKVMKITFDSQGGNSVSSLTVKCDGDSATIKSLPTTSKSGYDFMSWVDTHGTPILEGALLTCENITLYANYTKKEEPKAPTPTPSTPSTPTTKTYKCPAGYTLKDTSKCVKLASAEKYCEGNWKLVNGECVNPSSPNPKGTRTCPQKTYGGWTGTGTYYEAGPGYCGYEELPSYTGTKTYCEGAGGTLAANNHCYKHIEMNNYQVTCASDEKMFASQVIAPGNGGGCYQVSAAKNKCPDGYTSDSAYGECAQIINATYE